MSADNGLIVRKASGEYNVLEFDASSGAETWLCGKSTLEEAVKWANEYCLNEVVEYGIHFDIEGEELDEPALD